MKKAVLFLSFFILMIFSGLNLKSDVPSCGYGWNSAFYPDFLEVRPGVFCEVTIFYCWKYENDQLFIHVRAVSFFDKYCLIGAEISNSDLLKKVTESVIDNSTHLLNIPPCPDSNTLIQVKNFSCWKFDDTSIIPEQDLILRPCIESIYNCISEWSVCFDYSKSPPELVKTKISGSGTSICPDFGVFYPDPIPVGCFHLCD
ncbi:MAG: hypothetical protein KIT33_14740 [Candidatus Kapabacteria bacterium]|nr:hypothetical protein [Ignavibacteriota bacterium]MCW5886225.1 hypothetical protein [Candidatus Kapabacteria bacterium]